MKSANPVLIITCWTGVLAGIAAVVSGRTPSPDPAPRVVTVHVTLKDSHSAPIEGIAIFGSTGSRNACAAKLTDAQGHTDLPITLTDGDAMLYVRVVRTAGPLRSADVEPAAAAYAAKLANRSVKTPSMIPLVAGKDDYDVAIVAAAAVTLSGRLVDSKGAPVGGYVEWRGTPEPGVAAKRDGRFKIKTVAADEATQLLVSPMTNRALVPKVVDIPSSQTHGNVDIGDIPVDTADPSAEACVVSVQATNWNKLGDSYESYGETVLFVRSDCSILRICHLSTAALSVPDRTGEVRLPPGKYFALLGSGFSDPHFWSLLSVLRSKEGPEKASTLGISTVDASLQKPAVLSIDVVKSLAANRALQPYW